MKKSILCIVFALLAWASSAQVNATLFATIPNDINNISIKGNELYVAESVFFSGNIIKLDMTQSNPTPVMVLPDINVTSMDFIGNNLYYIKNAFELGVIDITDTNPTDSIVFNWSANNLYIQKIVSDGAKLFVLELEVDNNGMAFKFEISAISLLPSLTRTVLYSSTDEIRNFDYANGYLYFPNLTKQLIQRISTTNGSNPTPENVSSETGFFSGIKVVGTSVFVSNGDIIYRYNLNETDPIGIEFTTPLPIWPYWMDNQGSSYLYFTESQISKKIYKIDISAVSSAVDLFLSQANVVAVPNPSKDFVHIQGLNEATNYRILAANGTVRSSGRVDSSGRIDMPSFESGLYFLQLENGIVLKLIVNDK